MIFEHYVRLWGEPARRAVYGPPDAEVRVYKWPAGQTGQGVAIYATDGGSSFALPGSPASHRLEFVCGFTREIDDVAMWLAQLAAFPRAAGKSLGRGHTVDFEEPLWPGAPFQSWLILDPMPDVVPDLVVPGGNHVLFMHATPIFASEIAYKKAHGFDRLLDEWERRGVNFSDPARSPCPAGT